MGLLNFSAGQPPAGLLGKYYDPAEERRQKMFGAMSSAGAALLQGGQGNFGQVLGQALAGANQGQQNAGINYRQDAMGYGQLANEMENQKYTRDRQMKQDAWTNSQNQRQLEEQARADEEKQAKKASVMEWANKKPPEFLAWAENFPEEAANLYASEMTPEKAAPYSLSPGELRLSGDNKVVASGLPKSESNMVMQSDGNGGFTFQQGTGAKPLTESQSKDVGFATRAEGAEPIISQYENALTGYGDTALGMVPYGLGQGLKSTDYQLAEQAGNEFLTALLRKDSGATITPPEESLYGRIYLPRPGDGKELVAQKRQSRIRAREGINAGLPPAAIVAKEVALQNTQNQAPPQTQQPVQGRNGTPPLNPNDPLGLRR